MAILDMKIPWSWYFLIIWRNVWVIASNINSHLYWIGNRFIIVEGGYVHFCHASITSIGVYTVNTFVFYLVISYHYCFFLHATLLSWHARDHRYIPQAEWQPTCHTAWHNNHYIPPYFLQTCTLQVKVWHVVTETGVNSERGNAMKFLVDPWRHPLNKT